VDLFATASRSELGSTQTPLQWIPGVKQPVHEDDHPICCQGYESIDLYFLSSHIFMMQCLLKHKNSLSFEIGGRENKI
jgi:hypothetical protein